MNKMRAIHPGEILREEIQGTKPALFAAPSPPLFPHIPRFPLAAGTLSGQRELF